MKITLLGTGTSQGVPVIACECPVCCSSDPFDKRLRVSVLIEDQGKSVVIDSGPDFRYQMLRAGVKHLDGIVFTHEHKDHIAGMDDVRAFNYKHQKEMDIYATPVVQAAIRREFHYIFSDSTYPGIPRVRMHDIHKDTDFNVAGIHFRPVEVMHYKMPVMAYRIGDFTYITDAKTISDSEKEKIKGSRILIINALQKDDHISHFTLTEAVKFAQEIGAAQTYFTHISHKLGKHLDIEKELPPGIHLAYDGMVLEVD